MYILMCVIGDKIELQHHKNTANKTKPTPVWTKKYIKMAEIIVIFMMMALSVSYLSPGRLRKMTKHIQKQVPIKVQHLDMRITVGAIKLKHIII